MRIEVRGRNTEVTDELRRHVEKRFARTGKQVSDLAVLEVELIEERNPSIADSQVAEATLHLKRVTLRAREASPEMLHSIHEIAEDLRSQVKRHRDKRRKRNETRRSQRACAGARRRPRGRGRSVPSGSVAKGLIDRALRLGEARQFKEYERRVASINRFEPEMELLEDAEIRTEADELRERARERRAARRPAAGGVRALSRGGAADPRPAALRRPADRRHGPARRVDRRDEDRRGQDADRDPGRVPQLARRDAVHLVTVNDYLARRDAEWMGADLRRARG